MVATASASELDAPLVELKDAPEKDTLYRELHDLLKGGLEGAGRIVAEPPSAMRRSVARGPSTEVIEKTDVSEIDALFQ